MALQQIVEQTVIGLGYDLVEIERSSGGLLRITIDLPWQAPAEGAAPADEVYVTVEDCEKVTRQLQFALEVEAVEYQRLEVSSPGIDRPLRHEQDFARFEGEVIDLTLKQPIGAQEVSRHAGAGRRWLADHLARRAGGQGGSAGERQARPGAAAGLGLCAR